MILQEEKPLNQEHSDTFIGILITIFDVLLSVSQTTGFLQMVDPDTVILEEG